MSAMPATAEPLPLAREPGPGASDRGGETTSAIPSRISDHAGRVVALTLHRFHGVRSLAWAFGQMQWVKRPLSAVPGIEFYKVMGTGGGSGFSTVPNPFVVSLLTTWHDGRAAAEAMQAEVFRERDRRARETATLFLSCIGSRGRWSGSPVFVPDTAPVEGEPVAALTRATVRPARLARFWRRVPAISRTLEGEAGVRFALGMGEVPYLHQVTFSVWRDAAEMRRFSRESDTHGEAVRRVAEEGWFSEQLFARFRPLGALGRWGGQPAGVAFGLGRER